MNKIALITDSTCGLPKEYINEYDVRVVPLKILYKDKEFIDGINITPEEVYSKLPKELPTTSMPSVDDIISLYNELIKKGYTQAIVLPVSSGLSGTINSFKLASEEFKDKINTFIFDTKILSMAVGLIVIEVGKMIKKKMNFEDICNTIPKLRENLWMYFSVDTLEYLIKGGRIGKVTGGIGEILNLKPIITMDDNGSYTNYTKVRGSKQAFKKLLDLSTDILNKGKGKVIIMTGTMHEEAEKLKEILSSYENTTFIYKGTITPAVGIHSGPRLLAVAIMSEI
ncbi:DegV family protein [Clostridium tertium]|uniref:DegV family protein n=1 Tax=Clostridium tertium TaxID=1559 RepID=UPI0020290F61|nr:DegV family protein [Clostridium tertium]MDB1922571.1 DegV family protein [Clostridium tertium]MDB1926402.1 DegV family protein [Clostridium tertium]MDB1928928.1 DegV family protein [Clostridium tertium]MDY4605224.1 DegV family protein [Clostridium tertium]